MYGSYLDAPGDMQLRPTITTRATMGGQVHQDITVGLLDDDERNSGKKRKTYTGRKRVWPGALILLIITAGALSTMTYFGIKNYNKAQEQQELSEYINGGIVNGRRRKRAKIIPIKVCQLPNYVTDDGKLYATNGTEKVEVRFTGINWSGMENIEGVPHGLALGQSSIDNIAKKLNEMEINAVRLPLNAKMIISNSEPDVKKFVDVYNNPDLAGVGTYIDMIKKIVQGLAKQQIAVLLDIHKIDPLFKDDTSEHLWYTDDVPYEEMLAMFKLMTSELCNDLQYNIIGVDIKNEPVGGCWPKKDSDGTCPSSKNWPRAVEEIGNEILKICPNWLIVAEGLYAQNLRREINGQMYTYNDWYGASLQNATENPIKLTKKNKLVYAPHFYSPSVYPASYFFAEQSTKPLNGGHEVSVVEYPDTPEGNTKLRNAVYKVMDEAFGNVVTESGVPVFLGEFGGIYGSAELLKGKTSTRVLDMVIQYASDNKMTGGFSWALNPDGRYDFNDEYVKFSKTKKPWQFGLYADEKWDKLNEEYAAGLRKLKGNGIIPCFQKTLQSQAADGTKDEESETEEGSKEAAEEAEEGN